MQTHSIVESAKILKVTDKTIRNYIERGFLNPEKWNGTWRISRSEISELFWKKYGKTIPNEDNKHDQTIQVQKTEFEQQQQSLGKLTALEVSEMDLREENRKLIERNAQLEASAASGWTEARTLKEELNKLQGTLQTQREQTNQAKRDVEWLRRELEELQQAEATVNKTVEALRIENERLSERLLEASLGIKE